MNKEKIERIGNIIIEELGVNIYRNTRKLTYVDARSLYCYILREDLDLKLREIKEHFESKRKKSHHTTVLHLINIYDEVSKRRPEIAKLRENILLELSPKLVTINKIKECDDINKLNRIYNILIE